MAEGRLEVLEEREKAEWYRWSELLAMIWNRTRFGADGDEAPLSGKDIDPCRMQSGPPPDGAVKEIIPEIDGETFLRLWS